MTKTRGLFVFALGAFVFAVALASAARAATNPFFSASSLPYQAPRFDVIRETDYAPAIEEGMKRQLAEIATIAENPEPPTFANTLEAIERSGDLLTRVTKVFLNLAQSNTSPGIQKIKAEEAPRLAAHQDAIFLNPKLYARVRALYEKRDELKLDPESRYLIERYHLLFIRAGAELPEPDKAKLRALNEEESRLKTQFSERLLADTNASAVVIENREELRGLSEGDIAAAAAAAKEAGLQGKWLLTLQNTTQQPALGSLQNRSARERLFRASTLRGDHGGPNDTKAIVARIARLRSERARLLGFHDWAAFVLDDQMAKNAQNAEKLMTDLVPAATARARDEADRMQKMLEAEVPGARLGPADWELYAGKVGKAEYDLDESAVRPYLDLDRVLRDGVFFAANRLYGITFKERRDIPVYQPDVRAWEVFDSDGKSLALYYGDFFSRPNKGGGAWCDSFVDQSRLIGTKPVIFTVTNFTKPAPGQPALLSFTNVTTMFHEFGHALHGIFQNVNYPTLGGTPQDWGEFPSQFNEHWALEDSVLRNYAKHFQTGKPIPDATVARIRKAKTFNQGYATTEYLASALLDMAWHELPADTPEQDVNAFESAALKRFRIDVPEVPPRYHTTYFAHIWESTYAAGYYAYLWSEVLDDDAFYWFKENGGMTRANGQRYRDMILSRGGTADVASLYRAFRGRDPVVGPLLEERGLRPQTGAKGP